MRIGTISLGLMAALALGVGTARGQALDAPSLDRYFLCPETLDRDQNPARPSASFIESLARAAPGASDTAVRLYWRQLLVQHACAKSISRILAREEAIRDGAVEAQTWLPAGGDGTVSLGVSEDFLEPFVDPRATQSPALETYIRAAFTSPHQTDLSGQVYDEVVSHVIYYCDVRQRALIENDYFLAGRPVRREPHAPAGTVGGVNVYAASPVPVGSLSAMSLNWACGAVAAASVSP